MLSMTASTTLGLCCSTAEFLLVKLYRRFKSAPAFWLSRRLINAMPSESETGVKLLLLRCSKNAQFKEMRALGTSLFSCGAAEICMEVCRKGNLPNEPRIPALRASMGRMTAAIQAALPAVAGSENGYVRIRANHFPNRTAAATAPTSPQITGKSDQMVFNTAAVSSSEIPKMKTSNWRP